MRISKSRLKKLIESYLREQEEEASAPEQEEQESDSKEETEAEEPSQDINVDDLDEIPIEIDGEKKIVKFFRDTDDTLKYKVDGVTANGKSIQDFLTVAGLGMLVKNIKGIEVLEKIMKIDTNLANKSVSTIKDIVKQKMNTERKGFTVEDIRKALET